MIFGVYAIRDVRSGFMTPAVEPNDAVAHRNFAHAVQNSESILFTHSSDFTLFKIGTYDSDSGKITPLELIEVVCSGTDVLK